MKKTSILFYDKVEAYLLIAAKEWTFRNKSQHPEAYNPQVFMLDEPIYESEDKDIKSWKHIPCHVLANHVRQMIKDGLLDASIETDENGISYIHIGEITLKGAIYLQNHFQKNFLIEKLDEISNGITLLCHWINGFDASGKLDETNILSQMDNNLLAILSKLEDCEDDS